MFVVTVSTKAIFAFLFILKVLCKLKNNIDQSVILLSFTVKIYISEVLLLC